MTLRTFTINTELAKVVPRQAMPVSIDAAGRGWHLLPCALREVYRRMVDGVPDTLPGVVEHPAQPTAEVLDDAFDCARAVICRMGASRPELRHGLEVLRERVNAAICAMPAAPAQPVERQELSDERIREVFLENGFTIKDGQTDLKPYVYAAAHALLSAAQRDSQPVEDTSADARDALGVQWWLAELDVHGNPKLKDGAHSERAGADKAAYLINAMKLAKPGTRYAVARVELYEPKPSSNGVNHDAIASINAAIAASSEPTQ